MKRAAELARCLSNIPLQLHGHASIACVSQAVEGLQAAPCFNVTRRFLNSWQAVNAAHYQSHPCNLGFVRNLSTGNASSLASLAVSADHADPSIVEQHVSPSNLPIFSEKISTELSPEDVAAYYRFGLDIVPEALPKLFQLFYAPLPGGRLRKGGCVGLQHELQLSKDSWVMFRSCFHDLWKFVQSSNRGQRMLLLGPTGCGKSVMLASMVEWARRNGWIVFYIPSAETLTRGGYCRKLPGRDKWDTIISAQHILKGMLDAHEHQLQNLSTNSTLGNVSLLEIVKKGLATEDRADVAVDACLTLRDQLIAASDKVKVLFAIDDYNYLHWKTEYGAPLSKRHRRELTVDELTLASGMRLLQSEPAGSAHVVCSVTSGQAVSPGVHVPTMKCDHFHVPRFCEEEVANVLEYYHQLGVAPKLQSWQQVEKMLSLSNGDGNIVRRYAPRISAFEMNMI